MPYWRLSGFYFFFFGSLGALTPYLGLYFQSIGFAPQQIGLLMATLLATKIISPNVWAWIADHSARTLPVVRVAALLALILFATVYWARTFWWVALAMFGFSFFWNAVLPQVEAVTLNHLGSDRQRYGRVRLWGSFGFIVFVLVLGPIVEACGPAVALPAVGLALLGVWVVALLIPEPGRAHFIPDQPGFWALFKQKDLLSLLLCCLLMQASHAPFYTFFSIYLSDYGYSKTMIGALWAFGTICEIGVFYFMHRIHRAFTPATVLAFSFVITAIRWILVALFPEWLSIIVITQAMHAVTFGAYHASALQLFNKKFQGAHQHRGLALYGSVSFGVGGAVGSFYSGYVWAGAGPAATFIIGAGVASVAAMLAYLFVRPAVD